MENTTIRKNKVPRRNSKCECGSGKKFKKCCMHHYIEPTMNQIKSFIAKLAEKRAKELQDAEKTV